MPYNALSELPDAVKKMPKHAQEIYMSAFNSAFKQYEGNEGKAHGTAWAAVKNKYKQVDGKWIAKESKEVIMANTEELQSKYSEIIQEIGKRNASADEARIKKIITICNELLASDKAEENAVGEAIKEADNVMEWLKAQEAMKTDDGVKFPAEAYAYVPDADKPSTWKLRLWEDPTKKVTRVQLGRAAAALSPGGFRGQKVQIPAGDLGAVKRKIRSEYRKLDVEDEDIPRWVKEAETRELLVDYVPLTEAKFDKGNALITIIKPGFNATKQRYYPAEVLARDYGIFEGVKMYADHPTEQDEKQRPERSIRDWIGTLTNVKVKEDGSLGGKATIVEPWMQEKLAILRDKGMLSEMGTSINAIGSASNAEIDGVKTKQVESLVRARSVDFVTEAGAGGGVDLYESVDPKTDIDLVDLASLKERRADLVSLIESEVKAEIHKEVKHKMELEEKVTELEGQVETITKERDELKTKLEEADKEKAKAEVQATVKDATDKAELPEVAKERILEKFKDAESADGIEDAIKAEADYIAKITEAGKVKGMGPTKVDPVKAHKELVESFKRTGMTDKEAEIAAKGR